MAKKPDQRHSKDKRDPVTIDLDSSEVTRIEDEKTQAAETSEAEAVAEANAALDDEQGRQDNGETTAEPDGQSAEAGTPADEDKAVADDAAQSAVEERSAGTDDSRLASGTSTDEGDQRGEQEPAPSAARPEPQRRSGGAGAIAGGVIGAALTLAVAGGAWYAGFVPAMDRDGSAVEQQSGAIEALRSEIETLKAQVSDATAGSTAQPDVSGDLEALRGELATLSQSLQGVRDDVAVLGSASGGDGNGEAAAALGERLSGIEQRLQALSESTPADSGGLDAETVRPLIDEATAPLAERIGQASEAASAAQAAVEGLQSTVAELQQSVAAIDEKLAQDGGQADVARAIAATALKSAIDRGQPFMTELETFASVTGGGEAVDALRSMAATGVPTRADIADDANDAAYAMIDATQTLPEDAGFMDRLTASARSLVKSRPVGTPEGDKPADIAARMVSAVERGDYAAALAEYETMPEAAKAAGADFAGRLKARLEADRLVDDVLSSALKAAGQNG
ncbi:MAG: hypothetical protein CMJ42_20735 [Phyllobacteriaceae bacterium]|nr:hypothetical protein [Phyllobacteriaceae bacterium]MBA90761.1 hypothetical protein [Phyllobacteriaceae bacterium]